MKSALAAAGLLCAGVAAAGDFEFADFASVKGLHLVDNAHRAKKVLRLTNSDQFQAGAAWYEERQPVSGGFETTFTFRCTDPGGGGRGADGIAFVVQNQKKTAIGGLGASAGFMRSDNGAPGAYERGITSRLAVFFDTFENRWDGSDNALAICPSGPVADERWPPRCLSYSERLRINLKDEQPHTARITYQPPRLSVFLDGKPEPVDSLSVDLAALVGGDGTAWVGFTAATGGSYENHDVLSWKFTTLRPDTSSKMTTVDSSISYLPVPCLPDRKLCTPKEAVIEEKGPGFYHVYLPANLEWGVSVPHPEGTQVRVMNVTGMVCWDPRVRETTGCNGPNGNGIIPGREVEGGAGFVYVGKPAGSLVARLLNGRAWFTVNDRGGESFADNEGYFEFDILVAKPK